MSSNASSLSAGSLSATWRTRPDALVAVLLALLVALRIVVLLLTPLELGADEAQYWRWSRNLDWGYYSKPPLIAWAIALPTAILGSAEWAVRLAAPILHGIAAFVLYLLGKRMASPVAGAWAAAFYALMPGVFLSSAVMSTDAVLLPVWSLSLLMLWRMRTSPTLMSGALAGAAIGLAALAKYAALYLVGGAVLAALIDVQMRRALLSPAGIALPILLALVISPNLYWNANHGFETISHTTDNAAWGSASFNPGNILKFLADQMGVFGPVSFVCLILAFIALARTPKDEALAPERWLSCFILPPLVIILGQAFISRAHGNWAATAYPAASMLLGLWIARGRLVQPLKIGAWVNAVVGALMMVLIAAPAIADSLGMSNGFKRVRGWKETAVQLAQNAKDANATAIMFDEREIWHGVDYYGRNAGLPPLRAWRVGETPRSTAEDLGTMMPGEDARVLVASYRDDFVPRIRADFSTLQPAGDIVVPLGGNHERRLRLFVGSGYKPLPRDEAYRARFPD